MNPKVVSEQGEVVSTYLSSAEADVVRKRARAAERTVAAELRLALRPYLSRGFEVYPAGANASDEVYLGPSRTDLGPAA